MTLVEDTQGTFFSLEAIVRVEKPKKSSTYTYYWTCVVASIGVPPVEFWLNKHEDLDVPCSITTVQEKRLMDLAWEKASLRYQRLLDEWLKISGNFALITNAEKGKRHETL